MGTNRQPSSGSPTPPEPGPPPPQPPAYEDCSVVEYSRQKTEWDYKEEWSVITTVVDVALRIASFGLLRIKEERVVNHYYRKRSVVERWKEDSCIPGETLDYSIGYGDWSEWKWYSPSGEGAREQERWVTTTKAGEAYRREASGMLKAGVGINSEGEVSVMGRTINKRVKPQSEQPTESDQTQSITDNPQQSSDMPSPAWDVDIFVTGFQDSSSQEFSQGANIYENKTGSTQTDWNKVYALDPLKGMTFTGNEINAIFRHGDTLSTHDFDFRDVDPDKKYRIVDIDYGSSTTYNQRVYTNPTKNGKIIKGNYARYRILLETIETGR